MTWLQETKVSSGFIIGFHITTVNEYFKQSKPQRNRKCLSNHELFSQGSQETLSCVALSFKMDSSKQSNSSLACARSFSDLKYLWLLVSSHFSDIKNRNSYVTTLDFLHVKVQLGFIVWLWLISKRRCEYDMKYMYDVTNSYQTQAFTTSAR